MTIHVVDTLRLLVTILGALLGLAVVGWTIEARRRVEAEDDRGREAETIRDLVAQLKIAGRRLRRLSALERAAEVRREHEGILAAVLARLRSR